MSRSAVSSSRGPSDSRRSLAIASRNVANVSALTSGVATRVSSRAVDHGTSPSRMASAAPAAKIRAPRQHEGALASIVGHAEETLDVFGEAGEAEMPVNMGAQRLQQQPAFFTIKTRSFLCNSREVIVGALPIGLLSTHPLALPC